MIPVSYEWELRPSQRRGAAWIVTMQMAGPECSPQNSWKSWVSEFLTAELGVGVEVGGEEPGS